MLQEHVCANLCHTLVADNMSLMRLNIMPQNVLLVRYLRALDD